jgi:hypothetical protein
LVGWWRVFVFFSLFSGKEDEEEEVRFLICEIVMGVGLVSLRMGSVAEDGKEGGRKEGRARMREKGKQAGGERGGGETQAGKR